MKMKSNTWVRLFVVLIVALLGKQVSQAQCVSANPTTIVYYNWLVREAGNDLWTVAGTTVEGDYYFNWIGAVTFTMYRNGPVFEGRQNIFRTRGNGGSSRIFEYHDALSVHGSGEYATYAFHEAACAPNWYSSQVFVKDKTVVRPTINPYGIGGVWWLGAFGAHDAPNGYYPTAGLAAEKNCGPGDTCNEVPVWSITQNPQKLSISGSPGTTVQVTAQEPSGAVSGDIRIIFSIGGFQSEPLFFTVNTPKYLVAEPPGYPITHDPQGNGYISRMAYASYDKFNNQLTNIAVNKAITPWFDVISNNWNDIAASGHPGPGAIWNDAVEVFCSATCNPPLQNPQNPLGSTEVDRVDQTWRLGSQIPGLGVTVQTNKLRRYLDHALHTNVVSPVP